MNSSEGRIRAVPTNIILFSFLTGLHVDRMKAVFITDAGIFGYNVTADALTEIVLDGCLESRIEIISENLHDSVETQLLDCVED